MNVPHFRNGKPTLTSPPVEPVLCEGTLNSVKDLWRSNHRSHQHQRFKYAVRQSCVWMQYSVEPPFRCYRFPRPPSLEPETNLVCTSLSELQHRVAHVCIDTELLKP